MVSWKDHGAKTSHQRNVDGDIRHQTSGSGKRSLKTRTHWGRTTGMEGKIHRGKFASDGSGRNLKPRVPPASGGGNKTKGSREVTPDQQPNVGLDPLRKPSEFKGEGRGEKGEL